MADAASTKGPRKKYEPSGASVRVIVWFVVGIVILLVFSFFAVRWTVRYLTSIEKQPDLPAIATQQLARQQTGPPLLANPPEEYRRFQYKMNVLKNSYGWVDREQGIARIPVDRAMELILERGLPVRPADNETTTTTLGSDS